MAVDDGARIRGVVAGTQPTGMWIVQNRAAREAVAVFQDERSLQAAADELMISNFDRSYLSILAGRRTIERKTGHMYGRVTEVEDDSETPRIAYIGSNSRSEAKGIAFGGLAYVGAVAAVGVIVASGGTVATAIAGAVAVGGAGGLIGTTLALMIDRHHEQYLHDHLDRGGIVLWVKTDDAEHERRALEILERHAAEDVHIHELPGVELDSEDPGGGVSYDLSFMKRWGM